MIFHVDTSRRRIRLLIRLIKVLHKTFPRLSSPVLISSNSHTDRSQQKAQPAPGRRGRAAECTSEPATCCSPTGSEHFSPWADRSAADVVHEPMRCVVLCIEPNTSTGEWWIVIVSRLCWPNTAVLRYSLSMLTQHKTYCYASILISFSHAVISGKKEILFMIPEARLTLCFLLN